MTNKLLNNYLYIIRSIIGKVFRETVSYAESRQTFQIHSLLDTNNCCTPCDSRYFTELPKGGNRYERYKLHSNSVTPRYNRHQRYKRYKLLEVSWLR